MGDFRMPSLGADMETGTILEWRVAPGDVVARGHIMAVVSTEKADIEIETFEAGTIGELVALVGQEVPVGEVIATILSTDASSPAPPQVESPSVAPPHVEPPRRSAEPSRGRTDEPRTQDRRSAVSPRARRRATELGIDLDAVVASAGGRAVTADDVERLAGAAPDGRDDSTSPKRTPPPADASGRAIDAVGRLMAQSKRDIPHFYVAEEIDVSRALTWMEERNAQRPVEQRVLPAALLLRAVVLALDEVPELNGHLTGGVIVVSGTINLAVAISRRGGGLVAPVIHGAESLRLDELMGALKGVVSRARAGELRGSDVDTASITVTNLGDQGAEAVWGVIVPPQVAIVGFGRITERPWAVDGMLTVRRAVTATLSADHRASHGHQGARFLRAIARALEDPEALA